MNSTRFLKILKSDYDAIGQQASKPKMDVGKPGLPSLALVLVQLLTDIEGATSRFTYHSQPLVHREPPPGRFLEGKRLDELAWANPCRPDQ
jgi:hypothetical protein